MLQSHGRSGWRYLGRMLGVAVLAASLLTAVHVASAADDTDSKTSREREALRRAQDALHKSQEASSALERSRAEAEQKLKASTDELEQQARAARSAQASLRAQQEDLKKATDAQVDLAAKLEAANRQITALTDQQRELSGQLAARDSDLRQVRQDLQANVDGRGSCEVKNLKLYEYSASLLQQYRDKGVWSALLQKDPVFGIREVGVENVVQEYREKLATQKLAPGVVQEPSKKP